MVELLQGRAIIRVIHPDGTEPEAPPGLLAIDKYRVVVAKLQELIPSSAVRTTMENIRPAFQNCLDAYCRDHRERLVLIPELRTSPATNPTAPSRTVQLHGPGLLGGRRTPTTTWTRR